MAKVGAIILAAGAGTRLNSGRSSEKPKVLYEIGGKPMIDYTLELLDQLGLSERVMVVGYQEEMVRQHCGTKVKYASQPQRQGTAHAAKVGEEVLSPEITHLLIIQGDDSAFYKAPTIQRFLELGKDYQIAFTTAKVTDPSQYGRVIRNGDGEVEAIVEKESLTGNQKDIDEVNAATYLTQRFWFNQVYPSLQPSAVGKGEIIMPDLIGIAFKQGLPVLGFKVPTEEWVGVNTPEELAKADNFKRGF